MEIPALAVRTSISTKMSKELTIKAIEARLKAMETQTDDFVINQNAERETPLIQKYQYNKMGGDRSKNVAGPGGNGKKFGSRYGGPYNRNNNQRRQRR